MTRPISIVWFERCYLGALVVGLVNTFLSWNATLAKFDENPAMAQLGSGFGGNMLVGSAVLSIVISLLLWYFTARKASVVTKWIVTVFFVLGLLGFVLSLAQGTMPQGLPAVLGVVAIVLNAIAVWQLFKPDAKVWFGENAA